MSVKNNKDKNKSNNKNKGFVLAFSATVLICFIGLALFSYMNGGLPFINGNNTGNQNETSSFSESVTDVPTSLSQSTAPSESETSKPESTENTTEATTEKVTDENTTVSTENTTAGPTVSTTESTTVKPENNDTTKVSETAKETVKEKRETVYTVADVNIRKGPSTSYGKLGTLEMGSSVTRLAKYDNGWSKIEYNGKTAYISSNYLTEEKPVVIERTKVYPNEKNKKLIVVNQYREFDKSYVPKLKKICPGSNYNVYMDKDAADAFTEMYNAAKKDGITLYPISGYRDYARQETNYKNRVALWRSYGYSYNEAVNRTKEVILPPGTSEHNLGLAMDIGSLEESFSRTKAYKWLNENAADYGFILRYKSEWYDDTGIISEPWHWRFVGKENAAKIQASGLSLEKYLGITH